ncbi:MAG: hypothetical protein JWN40_2753 [Phycisphaerales bacterium]|nr:hypothetical protein [Phycisphaerales bacterium]
MELFPTALRSWKLSIAASLAAMSLSGLAHAQVKNAPPARPAAPGAPVAAATVSPEAALEDKLMGSLAAREMDSLLEYYFKKHNIPPERQAGVKSIVAWRELSNPKMTVGRRRQLLQDGVRGVKTFLDSMRDTEMLMTRAAQLIEYGMKDAINQIEYYGETPSDQAELNESAEAVIKILDKTIAECEAQEGQVLAGQTRPSQALLTKWQTLDDRLQTAKWTKAFSSYGLALSLDPASPRRKEIADAAIAFLKDFEDPSFQREAAVKLQTGKLDMVKGDIDAAVVKFAEAQKVKGIDKEGQYNTLFFNTLANLVGKREQAAVQSFDALQKWVAENLKGDEQKFVAAGVGLLDYRINELRAELAKTPEDKKKLAAAGETVLSNLMKENPRLGPPIKKMLLGKLPADADLTKLDTVLLRALMAKGVDEVIRAKDGVADNRGKPVIERAIVAAGLVQKRAGQPNVTDDVVDEASFFEPIFFAKLGKNAETIEESLDYIKNHGKNKDRVANALANALAAVDILRKTPEATNERISGLITRTWQVALAAGMKEYAFMYGKRLFDQGQFKEAAAALKQVPANSPAMTHARFYELSALQQRLDDKDVDAAAKSALVSQIENLAADVNNRIDADLGAAKEEQKPRLRYYKASAILLAADLKLKAKDHQGVLTLLTGFEETAKGLPTGERLAATALRYRVDAYMALGKTQDAVDEVKKLVAASQGSGGQANVLFTMIGQMDEAFVKAKVKGDKDAMRQNSAAQVALITPLIEQTKDEAIKNKYKKWKAQLVLRAARNEDDQARRSQYLTEAQGTFTELLKLAKEETPEFDNLRYQLALVSYELKDYKKVQQEMGQLIADGKLGPPDVRESNPADGTDTFK